MNKENKAFFSIDSKLLFELGENLVTNRTIALSELVKNSYDADATKAIVRMNKVTKLGGTIVVEDNGIGMSLFTFNKTWMRIATIDKETNPISRIYGRQKAGKKGIGRFACRRLSKRLILISVSAPEEAGKKEELTAIFNWPTFIPGSDVNEIPVNFSVKEVDKKTHTGTVLILEDANEEWNDWNIRELRNELIDLILPTTFKPEIESKERVKEYDPGFHIEFEFPEFPRKEKPLDADFFKRAWTKLTGYVDEKGDASYKIGVINKIIEKKEKSFNRDHRFKYLRNTKLDVYIFSYRPDLFKRSEWGLTKTRKIVEERGGIRVFADNFRVFGYGEKGDDWLRLDYDRARSVIGVDEEVGKLAEDKRPGLRLFRNQQLFGHVEFSKNNNPTMQITVNRERLIDNESFMELRKFVRLGIDFATVLYANEISKEIEKKKERERAEEEARKRAAEEERQKIEEARKRAEERALRAEEAIKKAEDRAKRAEEERKRAEEGRKKAEEARRNAEEERRRAEEDARRTREEQAEQKAKEALVEEREAIRAETAARLREEQKRTEEEEAKKKVEEERTRAERIKAKELEEREKAGERLLELKNEELRKERQKFEEESSRLRVLASTGTLIMIFEHELQALIEDMEEMVTNFSFVLKQLKQKQQKSYNDVLESFSNRTEMIKELGEFLGLTAGRESRLEKKEWVLFPIMDSVFRPFRWYFKESGVEYKNLIPDNLRTPKMYRSELVSILHNLMSNAFKAVKGEIDRRIEVIGFEQNGHVHVQVLDSGKGLNKTLRERVFEPFESYSEPDLRFGVGTGLGLNIVRDIVRSYHGEVRFIDALKNWKTCIEIILPLEE